MKKNKNMNYATEEQKEIKKFIFVLVGLIIIVIGIYFFTRAFVTKDLFNKTDDKNYTEGTINYEVAIVGNMLSRPAEEYYLLAFDSESTKANYYNALVEKYLNSENSLKVYFIDLTNELNKKYVAEDKNISQKFENIENLKLGDVTLIRVKNKNLYIK